MHIEEVRNITGSEPEVSCSLNDGVGIYTAADTELNGNNVKCSDFTTATPILPTTGKQIFGSKLVQTLKYMMISATRQEVLKCS